MLVIQIKSTNFVAPHNLTTSLSVTAYQPPALLHCVGGFSFNHVFQIHNPPIGRNPPRHNSTGNVPVSGNPSNIDAGRYLLQPVSDYIPAFSFPSIGRRNSYNNNAPNPGANCGYRRCTLCRNYRISFLLLPFGRICFNSCLSMFNRAILKSLATFRTTV